ncbi:MAG: NYN domain-containing protein [Rhodospirillales bacterium]|nr:NYN domain-containing protein [Rhodospirillales bacterium]
MKAIVYVDGFNLYYGALKRTPYKWLNIMTLCNFLLPKNRIVGIKYFTALVTARPNDPDQPTRQQIYLRALRTLPNLEIIYGHFLEHVIFMPLADPAPDMPKRTRVIKTEEKGSDVNIASHLVNDGHKKRYEAAILISNDSDLVEPVKIVRGELRLPVGVLNPIPDKPSHELRKYATFVKPIRKGVLAASQFPPTMQDAVGTFHKPPTW